MTVAQMLAIMVMPYLEDEEDIALLGPYLAALAREDDENAEMAKKWFTCRKCLVQWKIAETRSHCFVCGKWGTRGCYVK